MRSQLTILLIAAAALLCTGCATGSTKILSEPPGARIFIEDKFVGETPATLTLDKRTHRLRLEKEGYEAIIEHIGVRSRDAGELTLGLFGLFFGLTGYDAKYTFDDSYAFRLKPLGVIVDPAPSQRE